MSSDTSDSIQRGLGETTFIEPSGGVLTEQLIQKLRNEKCSEDAVQPKTFQYPDDPPSTTSELEARISEAWDDLEERWDEVTRDNELFGMEVSEARRRWILKLFEGLGFDPEYQQANLSAGELEANLTHSGWPRNESVTASQDTPDSTPPVLHTIRPDGDHPLDDGEHRGAVGRQQSPHDELQRYLNSTDDIQWSIVTDGLKLRILRDYYHTYTRGYVEFDLENIFTNRNYDDFRALYRLCHASRFIPRGDGDDAESPLESLYQVALATGVKVGEDLQSNVIEALETLGNGFLNQEIREALEDGGQEEAEAYYQDLLRIVYRLLFLLFAEQRGMMAARGDLYTREYGINALRERGERKQSRDHQTDLWEGLKVTFGLVGQGVEEEELHVPGYNGGLFDDEKLEFVKDATCNNEAILSAINNLTHVEQQGYQQRISYADLGVDEIGAVYESLLEFTPQLADTALELDDRSISRSQFYLDNRGMERKETGSYYTKPELVDELIESALKPVVNDRLADANTKEEMEEALLDVDVCDPAVGSGAFLIAANNYLGKRLAEIRSDSLYPDEKTIRHARRSVVQHCIYGVDKNPMAVELAKVSLWINSSVDDKPLSFLDHRIKRGNSLIGTTHQLISNGVPDGAFETSKGRDYHVGTDIRRLVRNESANIQSDMTWYSGDHEEYVSLAEKLDQLEENDVGDINEKERLYRELRESNSFRRETLAHDVWTAAFYWPLDEYQPKIKKSGYEPDEYLEANQDEFPTLKTIEKIRRKLPSETSGPLSDLSGLDLLRERAERIAQRESFFHWPLEFPNVFSGDGGFDCILGNPPWDKLTLEETKFFAVSAPHIADSSLTQSERQDLINDLEEKNPELYQDYQDATERVRNQKNFIKYSGRFPLSSHGIINLYAPFAELGLNEIGDEGASGIVVPTGIATDSNTQDYFRKVVEENQLASLYDFENKKGIFPDVHKQYKFCLLTLFGEGVPQDRFELAFYLTEIEQLNGAERKYSLSPDDIQSVNPNTGNCPTFRDKADADLTVDIYKQNSILKYEDDDQDLWGIDLRRMFNAGDDSSLFERKWDLDERGWNRSGNIFEKSGGPNRYLPIYESKMLHQHDHRFATYAGVDKESIKKKQPRELGPEEKDDESLNALPPYWVGEEEYTSKWEFDDDWHLVLRKVTNATNRRTVIASIIPAVATEDSVNHILHCDAEEATLLLSCLNSYVLDYAARQKVGGENLNQYIAEQLPVPAPEAFDNIRVDEQPVRNRIIDLTQELVYTAEDIDPFAKALDCDGGPYSFTSPNTRKREEVRFELEALLCHVYSRTSDDFDQLFSTFEQIKRQDEDQYGYYRTRDEIKKQFEELSPRITDASEED